jgi:hypothetical protein
MLESPRAKEKPFLKTVELPQPLLSTLQIPGHVVLQEEPESMVQFQPRLEQMQGELF